MRLIDADALDAAFTDLRFDADGTLAHWGDRPDWCLHGSEVEKLIHDAPTVATDINVPGKWISVEDRLPESGEHILATCEIHSLYGYKKQYVCEAYYAKEHSISEGKYPEDTDCYDYSEEDDEYYLKEGWYEVIHNWDEYGSVVIDDFVTHWMPLPEPPEDT